MTAQDKQPDIAPLVYIEEYTSDETGLDEWSWNRMPRFGVALHPTHGASVLSELKRIHRSRKFRLVQQEDEDVPF